ncbi:docking protein 1 [Sardina pilchardus]|uniref:docking protein 1 n=1 Tax=Sardina pilchardus TaxID=27697 RepID=UPI002E0E7BC9
MDTHVKRGEVYLQHQKHDEKWRRMWLVLYPSSRRGVARLEMSDADGGGDKLSAVVRSRHPERRVVRLAECVSVVQLPPHAEACPGDNMAAFCVETGERRLVFAAERDSCADWVERMCQIAFPMDTGNGDVQNQKLQMEENQIYVSTDEISEFRVNVQTTEASARCGLKGAYWLQAGAECLVLKDLESHRTVLEWPYNLLRRYGRDKMVFLIEAGRRCESGPGAFTFETRQGDDIFSRIETAVQEQRSSALAGVKRRPNSPLPSIPNSAAAALAGVSSDSSSRVVSNSINSVGAGEPIYTDPATVISFSKPMLSNALEPPDSPEIVYAEPMDAIITPYPMRPDQPSAPPPTIVLSETSEPVYSSPVNCVCPPLDPDRCDDDAEPVYSEVSDKMPDVAFPLQSQPEAVYSEPHKAANPETDVSQSGVRGGLTENKPMDDPSALYSKVNKPPKLPKTLSVQVNKPPKLSQTRHRLPHHGQPTPDIVYEDLGLI